MGGSGLPGRAGTGKGGRHGRVREPQSGGQVGGRSKAGENASHVPAGREKGAVGHHKKRRHERSIVRAGRPVTQLVSAGATPCTGAGRKPVERIPLFYENTTQNGTPRMPWGNYPAHRGLPAGRFSR